MKEADSIMRNRLAYILVLILAVACPATVAFAQAEDSSPLRDPPPGSIASQLRLKFRLMRINNGTLASSLDHNRKEWQDLLPDEREQYRREAVAFLRKSPEERDELLQRFEKLLNMSAERRDAYRRRAKWLQAVIETLTPAQRQELEKLTPTARARRLIEIRDELVRQGKLKLEEPTDSASAPATQPAPK